MKLKYYFVLDGEVQWFQKIVAVDEKDKVVEDYAFVIKEPSSFLTNIFDRELHFTNRELYKDSSCYYGWSISKAEFERIKEIIELYPSFKKFNQLMSL